MTKTMRKYQKWLLAVFGSMLMVTFLVQGPGSRCGSGDPSGIEVGTLNGRTLYLSEMYHAEEVYRTFEGVAPWMVRQLGIESATHWMLLVEEARAGGFYGDARDGREFIPVLAQIELDQLERTSMEVMFDLRQNPEKRSQYLARLTERIESKGISEVRRGGSTKEGMERALAELRGVMRLREADMRAPRVSDRALGVTLSGLLAEAVGDVLVIEGEKLGSTMPAPSVAELEAHFQKYREINPEGAPNKIGYVLTPRVKVEWLAIERDEVAKSVRLDPVAVNKRWIQNRTQYTGEFAAERARVEQDMTGEGVNRVMEEADRVIKLALQQSLRGIPEVDGFRTLPEDWTSKRPGFEVLASAVADAARAQSGSIVTPKVERREAWLGDEDIRGIPGFGSASVQAGGRVVRMPELLMSVKELAGKNAVGLQQGVPLSSAAIDGAGNRYYLMVTATRAKGPAESLGEVRDRAERDWRTLAAYDSLKADAERHRATAGAQGIEALAQSLSQKLPPEQKLTPRLRAKITREVFDASRATDILQDPAVRSAAFAVADTLDPSILPEAGTAPARSIAVPVDAALSLVVARIEAVRPLTHERVRGMGSMNVLVAAQRDVARLSKDENPFSFESLKKRLGYAPKRGSDDERAGEKDGAKQDEKSAAK